MTSMASRAATPEQPTSAIDDDAPDDASTGAAASGTVRPLRRSPFPARDAPKARAYVTVRGATVAMFTLFLACCLTSGWLGLEVIAGLGYAVGCAAAPYLVRRHALLQVVVAPPAVFLAALVLAQVLTAQGSSRHGRMLSVLEGTVLTLAALAPWLLAGTALGAVAAIPRGLRDCVRDLWSQLRPERWPWQAWQK